MRLRPLFSPGPPDKTPAPSLQAASRRSDPLPNSAPHSSTRTGGLHARSRLLREVRVEERGAVSIDLDGSRFSELLRAKSPAGQNGHGADAGPVRRHDIPDGVSDGHGLVRRSAGPLEGKLEDVGRGLGVLDRARVDHTGYVSLSFELRHVMLKLLVLGARDEPDLVATLEEGGDQLLRAR